MKSLFNEKNYNLHRKAEQPHISVRLSARGLDKEMGMSGTDAVSGKPDTCIQLESKFINTQTVLEELSGFVVRYLFFGNLYCVFDKIVIFGFF